MQQQQKSRRQRKPTSLALQRQCPLLLPLLLLLSSPFLQLPLSFLLQLTLRIRNANALRILNQNTFPAAPQNTIYWLNKSAKALKQHWAPSAPPHPPLNSFLQPHCSLLSHCTQKQRTTRWASIIESGTGRGKGTGQGEGGTGKGMLSVPGELSRRGHMAEQSDCHYSMVKTDSLAANDYQEDITRICQVIAIRIGYTRLAEDTI